MITPNNNLFDNAISLQKLETRLELVAAGSHKTPTVSSPPSDTICLCGVTVTF